MAKRRSWLQFSSSGWADRGSQVERQTSTQQTLWSIVALVISTALVLILARPFDCFGRGKVAKQQQDSYNRIDDQKNTQKLSSQENTGKIFASNYSHLLNGTEHLRTTMDCTSKSAISVNNSFSANIILQPSEEKCVEDSIHEHQSPVKSKHVTSAQVDKEAKNKNEDTKGNAVSAIQLTTDRDSHKNNGVADNNSSNNWRCACEGGIFLPSSLLKSFSGAEAVFRMGSGQCYHKQI